MAATKSRIDARSSDSPGTPTTVTRCAALTTSGAAARHFGHDGAQNHNTTGRPTRLLPAKSRPSRVFAANANAGGTGATLRPGVGLAVDALDGAGVDSAGISAPPHAQRANADTTANTTTTARVIATA